MAGKNVGGTVSVGKKIQAAREGKGFPLTFVANETGFSVQHLEKIEAGEMIPPVSTILQISRALDIDSSLLLREQESTVTNRITESTKRTDNYAYKTLTVGTEKRHLKAFQITIEPMKEHTGVGYQHEGEEFVYVLSGKIEVLVGENVNILETGDSLHFNSSIRHKLTNQGETVAVLIVVLYVP